MNAKLVKEQKRRDEKLKVRSSSFSLDYFVCKFPVISVSTLFLADVCD